MKKVGIIDYGMSNLLSISRAIEKINGSVEIIEDPNKVNTFDSIILPGVGAFPMGMQALTKTGFNEAILSFEKKGNPILGICLGMQMLLNQSTEIEITNGLNIIPGECIKFPELNKLGIKNIIPHVGWESIKTDLKDMEVWNTNYMYFVHSFYAKVDIQNTLFTSPFGDLMFASGIYKNNVWGFQFHPEKSGENGLQLLQWFLKK